MATTGNTTLRVHGIVNVFAAAVEPEGGAPNPSPPSRYRTARGLALSQQAYFRQRYLKHYWSKNNIFSRPSRTSSALVYFSIR